MGNDQRLDDAYALYEASVFYGDDDAVAKAHTVLDSVEADLALARGRLIHADYLKTRGDEDPRELQAFERAAELYRELGDERGEAEALFWIGTYHQVLHRDGASSLPFLERAEELATRSGDKLRLSYIARHIGFVEQMVNSDLDAAQKRQEQSVALRREVGHRPGVAAGLLALAEIAEERGDGAERARLLDEAEAVATDSGAKGILRWISISRQGTAYAPADEKPADEEAA
jgi:hypothetical protein